MKTPPGALGAAVLLLLTSAAGAADWTKLDRTIVREPTYISKNPRYCLLVFGREAGTRVWLVADGDFLYVDRNGNGDLTGPDKRVRFSAFRPAGLPTVAEQREADAGTLFDGKLRHEHLRVIQQRVKKDFTPREHWEEELKALAGREADPVLYGVSLSVEVRPRPGDPIPLAGRINQSAGMDGAGFLQFAGSPKEAPVVHFAGALHMGLHAPQRLWLGPGGCDFQAVVGTPGLGKGTFASVGYFGLIADDVKPVVEVEFPPGTAGASPLTARFPLPHRC
jgi:hypothetical protein